MSRKPKTEVRRVTAEENNLVEVLRKYTITDVVSVLDAVISKCPDLKGVNLLREMRVAMKPPQYSTLDELVEKGSCSEEDISYLRQVISEGKNIAIIGSVKSGKTTLLHALLCEAPGDKSVVLTEQFEELDFSLSAPDKNITMLRKTDDSYKISFMERVLKSEDALVVFGDVVSEEDVLDLSLSLAMGHSVVFTLCKAEDAPLKEHLKNKVLGFIDTLDNALEKAGFVEVFCSLDSGGDIKYTVNR